MYMAQAFEKKKRFIGGVEIGEYKGFGTISIPFGKREDDGRQEAFTFGYAKARAIVTYFEDIKRFVAESEKKYGNK